ncbi:Rrf2 family transcriptional regulator [Deinococcus maricopensis]|uniref:Transcriptional regulator, BadM/Rrf2 family n=1 Tax=Deinococcus maricopensis (strain DSM 21211 / LMG 22137 / NRRL B-23946 / LB-34) TaxID=709986 RepID=E8U4B9_DEIML|nr:Rrf2 family transcriptional regulator [Deinococcus maricopensis]ADV65956.1 transcriptional regulator, BadM/Rrf2 family [Deinococcus maricopensis DSM 21211]
MNSQYAVAVHVLALISMHPDHARTSEAIAGSVGTNPVVVRNIIGLLRRAGLLRTQRGVAGAVLTRTPDAVTLLDVYRAVNPPEHLFRLHEQPNPQCPVGSHIQDTLEVVFGTAQRALEERLGQVTLVDVMADLAQRAS